MERYVARYADRELTAALRRSGAVLIEGAKACGKTETAKRQAASVVRVDVDPGVRQAVEVDPSLVLDGPRPLLIDEWQLEPVLWNATKRAVDAEQSKGSFILTGSTAPGSGEARHSGAGRFARVKMSTLSFAESGYSTAEVSFGALLEGESPRAGDAGLTIPEVTERIACGGWPGFLGLEAPDVMANIRDYLDTVVNVDVRAPDGARRDPVLVAKLIRSLARGVATEVAEATLAKDAGVSRDTVIAYLRALERIFIYVEQPAWQSHLRSKASLRKSPKRHLADPALAVAALRAAPRTLLNDLNFLGQLFESQVVHDLNVLVGSSGLISHARDTNKDEVDAIVERSDGRWALVEIKLANTQKVVEGAAQSLKKFRDKVDTTHMDYEPELIVITATGLSYRRKDGVNVVAFTALGS